MTLYSKLRYFVKSRLFRAGSFLAGNCRPEVPHQVFFVITQPRSGSELFVDYLSHQPEIQCFSELLSLGMHIGLRPSGSETSMPQRAIAHLRNVLRGTRKPIRGCKLFLDQLEKHALPIELLAESFPDASYVFLYRDRMIEQFASFAVAKETGRWINKGNLTPFEGRIHIDPDRLDKHLEKQPRMFAQAWTALRTDKKILFPFELFRQDPAKILYEEVGPLLTTQIDTPKASRQRQNHRPISDVIENFDEIQAIAARRLSVIANAALGEPVFRGEPQRPEKSATLTDAPQPR